MIATETLKRIDEALEAAQDTEHRAHLGASIIGGPCLREIWYKWRWFKKELFSGRLLRLFDRGHREEPRFVQWLEMIGCTVREVDPETGKQFRISDHNGHFGGSGDGLIWGLPEFSAEWLLGEFKTHKDSSYKDLVKNGLCSSKPSHFAQMQTYMKKMGLRAGVYMAVNKDTDALHAEIVLAIPAEGQRHLDRAGQVIRSNTPPARVSERPGWYQCGFCLFRGICHFGEAPEKNCRTCDFSQPVAGGKWHCNAYNYPLTRAEQAKGCDSHKYKTGVFIG